MINLGDILLPLNSATRTFAILAKRGAGKSYTAGVMQEEFFKNNIPFVTFDPIDVHWGLRLDKNGKDAGLPIVVFGVQDNADIQLTEDMGVLIAEAVVRENISCVISTFGMSKRGQRRLIADFAEHLLRINKDPRHIFIEEAHEYVPQRVSGDLGRCFAAVEALVTMGRNRGLGVTLINQRAATINKDVLTQIDTLLAFRNVAPQDKKALGDWVEAHGSEENFTEFMTSLPTLPTGEGWIWSPEALKEFMRIKIRARQTYHPDREKLGGSFQLPKMFNPEKMDSFIEHFKKSIIGANSSVEKPPKPPKLLDDIVGRQSRLEPASEEWNEKVVECEKRILKQNKMINDLVAANKETEKKLQQAELKLRHIREVLDGKYQEKQKVLDSSMVDMWIDKVGRNTGAGRILEFLHSKAPMKFTRSQIALAIGMRPKGGSYNGYIQNLKRNKLIIDEGGLISVSPDIS